MWRRSRRLWQRWGLCGIGIPPPNLYRVSLDECFKICHHILTTNIHKLFLFLSNIAKFEVVSEAQTLKLWAYLLFSKFKKINFFFFTSEWIEMWLMWFWIQLGNNFCTRSWLLCQEINGIFTKGILCILFPISLICKSLIQ